MLRNLETIYQNILPDAAQQTLKIWAFGLTKIPILFFLGPRVVRIDNQGTEIVIPLTRRSKNHLNSMYFGALAAGADLAGGILVMFWSTSKKLPISLIFKDFHADFHKRAEDDVHFICEQGEEIKALVDKAMASGERENLPLKIKALCPKIDDELVASFTLTLSIKKKSAQ